MKEAMVFFALIFLLKSVTEEIQIHDYLSVKEGLDKLKDYLHFSIMRQLFFCHSENGFAFLCK